MKTIITFLFILNISAFSQWERIGFDRQAIGYIGIKSDQLIIPVSTIQGTVFYSSTNSGESWDSLGIFSEQWIGSFVFLNGVIFASKSWGCAFCWSQPCLFRGKTNFTSWDTLYYDEYGAYNLLLHNNNIYAHVTGKYIFSNDLGNTWNNLDSVPTTDGLSRMFSIDSVLYFSAEYFYNSTDNGETWTLLSTSHQIPRENLVKVSGYFFGDGDNKVSRSSNKGVDWESANAGLPENYSVWYLTNSHNMIFTAGWENEVTKIYYSENLGESWQNISKGLPFISRHDYILSLKANEKYLFATTTDGVWRYDISTLVTGVNEVNNLTDYFLFQNYPNPFNPSTTISWQSPVGSWQTLKVYDLLGREVVTLVDEFKPAGKYETNFDASGLPSGIYFYKLQAGKFTSTKKLILMK